MKKSLTLIIIVAIVAGAVLYSQGYLTPKAASDKATVVITEKGWNAVTIPSSWPNTTAKDLAAANPIIGMITIGTSPNTQSYVPGTVTPNFAITSGMELKIWTTDVGSIVSPEV